MFIAFKICFNSRFYYPVFTILFLDFGLSVAQFSVLNAVWAATIVLAEVPSGALADTVGRRRLLILAAVLMVFEIGIISFVPQTDPSLIFGIFLVNRVLSGLAEAAASGADEAIAYDALKEKGDPDQWGRVLEYLMRFQSMGFIMAMSIGAAVYDPRLMQGVCDLLGIHVQLTQQITMRFPLYLTFVMSILTLMVTLNMEEPGRLGQKNQQKSRKVQLKDAFMLTFNSGGWILKTPLVFSVIMFGMLFDGIIRMVITLASQYYRLIELPESIFGIIGSGVAVLGFFIPKIANRIAQDKSPSYALWVTACLTITGLLGMNFFWPYLGLIPAFVTFSAMYFNGFFVSAYVNRVTPSHRRATVLSFKGLSYNISYGVLGVCYALLLKVKKQGLTGEGIENQVFTDAFAWFPGAFVIGLLLMVIIYIKWIKSPVSKHAHGVNSDMD